MGIMLTKGEKYVENQKRMAEWKRQWFKENHPEEYEAEQKRKQAIWKRQDQGEIINPFIQNWLNAEISNARRILIIGMILTCLIQGQVIIWVIMYIAYRGRVKYVKEEALKADRKEYGR